MEMATTCLPMIGHLCDISIVTSLDKSCSIDLSKFNCWKLLETVAEIVVFVVLVLTGLSTDSLL